MNDTIDEQGLARDHQRFQQLIRSTFKALLISIIIGLVGGYLVYLFMTVGKFPVVVLYIPGILAAVVTSLSIRKRKKKWFPTPESLKAASEYKPSK